MNDSLAQRVNFARSRWIRVRGNSDIKNNKVTKKYYQKKNKKINSRNKLIKKKKATDRG